MPKHRCMFLDPNVDVIYVCPQHLGEDILHYYTNLLKCDGTTESDDTTATQAFSRRFIILTPEAVDYFPVRSTIYILHANLKF